MNEGRTVTLSSDEVAVVESLVANGRYGSSSEVVSAGIRAVQRRELELDEWLAREVTPVLATHEADPSSAIPAEKVFERLRARHATRFNRGG